MYAFFGGEKRDAMLAKQLGQFRKVLQEHNIQVKQRKPYIKKKGKETGAKKTPDNPTIDENVLSQLKN